MRRYWPRLTWSDSRVAGVSFGINFSSPTIRETHVTRTTDTRTCERVSTSANSNRTTETTMFYLRSDASNNPTEEPCDAIRILDAVAGLRVRWVDYRHHLGHFRPENWCRTQRRTDVLFVIIPTGPGATCYHSVYYYRTCIYYRDFIDNTCVQLVPESPGNDNYYRRSPVDSVTNSIDF